MKRLARLLRAAFVAAVASSAVFLGIAARRGVDTDLLSLAGIGRGHGLREASDAMAGTAAVIFEGKDAEAVSKAASAAVSEFGGMFDGSTGDLIRTIGEHGIGLLSEDARRLLEAGSYDEVMQASLSRLFGPVPPVVSARLDPFLLCSDYFESLLSAQSRGWAHRDGCMHKRIGDTEYAMVVLRADRVSQSRLCELRREGERQAVDGVKMWCSGPAFHTAVASASSRREINILSAVSALAVLLTGFALFRSFRFALPLVAAQASAFLVASAALFAVFGRPHVITFIFGTSLIGLSVDYVYHSLAVAPRGRRAVVRPLTLSMLTTVGGFLPFVFAPVPTLCQMALFSVSGIVVVYAFVVLFVLMRAGADAAPIGEESPPPIRRRSPPLVRIALVACVLVCAAAVPGLRMTSDPSAFYRPDPYLMAGDRLFAETSGGFSGRMAVTRGASLQEALENEERAGVRGVSAVVPSLKRQRENAALKARLYEARGAEYAEATGIAVKPLDASAIDDASLLDPGKLPGLAWLTRGWNGRSTATPVPSDFKCHDPSVEVYSVREELAHVFSGLTAGVSRTLGWSVVAMLVLFGALFRRKAPLYALPVLAGACSAVAALVATGTPITVFSAIAVFVVIGLGVDYTVFYRSEGAGPAMRRTVFFSFLTSFIGLGALAFTQFPVTRSMGIAFAGGLLGAYLAARYASGSASSDG